MGNSFKTTEYTILSHRKNNLRFDFILGDRFLTKNASSPNCHSHSAYEVHICVEGRMRVRLEDRVLVLSPKELCMIAPEKVHYVSFEENGHSMGFRFQVTDTERGGLGSSVPEFDELFHLHDGFVIRKSDLLEKYIFLASEPDLPLSSSQWLLSWN